MKITKQLIEFLDRREKQGNSYGGYIANTFFSICDSPVKLEEKHIGLYVAQNAFNTNYISIIDVDNVIRFHKDFVENNLSLFQ